MLDYLDMMSEMNKRFSLFTSYSTWNDRWHKVNLENKDYVSLFDDTKYLISEFMSENSFITTSDTTNDLAQRIFYILSTSQDDSMSLATIASKLENDCKAYSHEYEYNINVYAQLVYHLRNLGIFNYEETANGHPLIIPQITVKGELRTELDNKFASPLTQIGGVIGSLSKLNEGLLPGIKFNGKSTRRKTPLNQYDRHIVGLVSRQKFRVDMNIINTMKYYVPTITKSGKPITEQEQESARIAYYRFVDVAEHAEGDNQIIQLPTTQDSRGRFYNVATDPAVRLSLRSPKTEGKLTEFEQQHLRA